MPGHDPENTSTNPGSSVADVSSVWTFAPSFRGTIRNVRTPVVDASGVYISVSRKFSSESNSGGLLALDHDGDSRWQHETKDPLGPPALLEDSVVVASDQGITAYEKPSGDTAWERSFEFRSPLVPVSNQHELLTVTSDAIHRLDATTGKTVQKYSPPVTSKGFSRPVSDGEYVVSATFQSDGSNVVVAFDAETGDQLWTTDRAGDWGATVTLVDEQVILSEPTRSEGVVRSLSLTDGSDRWRETFDRFPEYNAERPSVVGETIALPLYDRFGWSSSSGTIVGLDITSGETRWVLDTAENGYRGVSAAGEQFLATSGCRVLGIDVDGELRWEQSIDSCDGLGVPIPAHSRLFVPGSERLHTFE